MKPIYLLFSLILLTSIQISCSKKADEVITDETTLSEKYPGDIGMNDDPAVIWMENFEETSIDDLLSRYEDHKNPGGMFFDENTPSLSSGSQSLGLMAGGSQPDATDIYKNFGEAGYNEWYIRWYVKHQANAQYHHTGVWFGGYNPPLNWPYPRAGTKPSGDDLFSIAIEANSGYLDFYNYWMKMHAWSDPPSSYWGNSLVHHSSASYSDQWIGIEVYIKINPDLDSGNNAALKLWINDELIVDFSATTSLGYWLNDKFCTTDADLPTCTDYPPDDGEEMIPLDLQVRTIESLQINYFWPQNFTSADEQTTVWYDDIVIATQRIGCLKYY